MNGRERDWLSIRGVIGFGKERWVEWRGERVVDTVEDSSGFCELGDVEGLMD